MDRRLQGSLGEAKAILYYTEQGYEVFLPTVNARDVDLVAIKGSKVVRVQVKTSSFIQPSGSFKVSLKTSGGNSSWSGVVKTVSKDFVDDVFVWCSDDSCWVVPSGMIHGRKTITLGLHNRQYQVSGPERKEYRKPGRKSQ